METQQPVTFQSDWVVKYFRGKKCFIRPEVSTIQRLTLNRCEDMYLVNILALIIKILMWFGYLRSQQGIFEFPPWTSNIAFFPTPSPNFLVKYSNLYSRPTRRSLRTTAYTFTKFTAIKKDVTYNKLVSVFGIPNELCIFYARYQLDRVVSFENYKLG